MQTKHGKGEITEFMGKTVSPAIPYEYDYEVFDNLTEAKNSDSWPSDSQVLKIVNQTSERSAKAKAYQEATKSLRTEYEKTRDFKVKEMIAALKLAGKSDTEAAALAEQLVPAE